MPKPPNGSIAVADDFPCLLNEWLQRFRNFVFGFTDLDAFEQEPMLDMGYCFARLEPCQRTECFHLNGDCVCEQFG